MEDEFKYKGKTIKLQDIDEKQLNYIIKLKHTLWVAMNKKSFTYCNFCKKDTSRFENLCGLCGEEKPKIKK